MSDNVIKRTTKLILFQAQQDHATEVVVRSSPGTGAAVRYKVADAWHEVREEFHGKSSFRPPSPCHQPGWSRRRTRWDYAIEHYLADKGCPSEILF
jgi:hypothetical protein